MEGSEVKALLKSAKDAIKNKEFKETLKICKTIIDKEKENYLAWVFTGAAAQELGNKEQSLAAFQRAIQISPNQAPAWQGLAQLNEKISAYSELISIYSELRKIFQSDPNKFYDYSLKYANSLMKQEKFSQAISVFDSLLKLEVSEKDNTVLIENLAKILGDSKLTDQPSKIYFEVIDIVKSKKIESIQSDMLIKLNVNALEALIRESCSWVELEKQCENIITNYTSENEIVFDILFEIYFELLIEDLNKYDAISEKINRLLEKAPSNLELIDYYKLIFNALKLLKNLDQNCLNDYKALIEQIDNLSKSASKLINVYLQNIYYTFVCDHANIIKTSELGLNLLSQLKVKEYQLSISSKFVYNLAITHFLQHNFSTASDLFSKILNEKENREIRLEATRYLIECCMRIDQKEKAIDLYKSVFDSNESLLNDLSRLVIKYYSNDLICALEEGKNLANSNGNNHDCNFLLSKICFSILSENFEELDQDELKMLCFQSNIKAIKLSPYKWESIYHLGKYYKYLAKDYKKALKCFQKSYELSQSLQLCGLELVDCLLHEKEDEIAFNVLKKAIEEIENCKWASLRLGIIYLKKGDCNEAIRLFYNVIRNDPDDYNMWECLADAYLNRGSLTASLKSFNKAIELNPDSTYASYQIAHIKQTLNLYDQAVIDYYAVLNKMTNHVPTLKGLGETYYHLAKENVRTSTDNKYFEHIENSIKYLTKAISIRKDLCCLWKILGDCCSIIRFHPKQETGIVVPKSIIEKNFYISDNELIKISKNDLMKLGEECYRICCKLKPDYSNYWYDLALNYFYQYLSAKNDPTDINPLALITKSKDCLINAINLESGNFSYWDSLGIIYSTSEINKFHMAQHCFIKSLKLNDSYPVTWTNLGVFYLLNNEFQLAHECFKKSQALDPEYSVAWIGQAFIAETVDLEQAVDLYRHAVELMLHTEALYGYARIVCKISTDPTLINQNIFKDYIQFLNAIPLASDCLVKYTDRIVTNPDAYFLAGILFEKLTLPLTSIGFYEKVFEISSEDDMTEISMLARRSYARLLCEQGDFEASLIQYKKIDVKNSIEDMFALAKVFFKLGKYQQCFKIFESSLNICSEDEKSIVFTAMGMAQSKYNIQEAITSFFKSFQCKVICIQSLFALCSIGLLKNDMKLINAVFKELDVINDPIYRFDILKLKSIYYCLQKEFGKAIICISKYVHEYPNESKSWTELCLCLKRAKSYDLALEIGHIIFKTNTQANLIRNTVLFDCIQYLLLQKLRQNNFKDDDRVLLKTFEKTLHIYPANLSSWNSFSQFLSSYEMENRNFKEISAQIEAVLG